MIDRYEREENMHNTRNVTKDILWVGGNDRRLALFENIFPIPRGVSYNSYLLLDEKTVLLDTVDKAIAEQFFENVVCGLNGRTLDYLIVNHMEPDHCALIGDLVRRYPELQLIGNAKTFRMLHQFFDFETEGRMIEVKEGDIFSAGTHILHFIMAPMVHWPETMVTYDEQSKILFSADGFGSFGALPGNIFNDELSFDRDWLADARRYYTNIVGKYGQSVQALLKKAAGIDIQMICPLHGPIWRTELSYILDKYEKWSTYEPEDKGVVIAYASMYGNTENIANVIAAKLADLGVSHISVYDVSVTHVSELIAEIFRSSHLVLAAPTYNGNLYPVMENLVNDMKALNVQKRTVALVENGTWAAAAAKQMRAKLEEMKDMNVLEQTITLKSAFKQEQEAEVDAFCRELYASISN